jgi:hypothetical protein
MESMYSKSKRRASAILFILGVISYFVFTKLEHVRAVSSVIDQLPSFASEKLILDSVNQSDKNYTLKMSIKGIGAGDDLVADTQAYYQTVAKELVCQSKEFERTFEQGYHVNIEIAYSNAPTELFQKMYVSKDNCQAM